MTLDLSIPALPAIPPRTSRAGLAIEPDRSSDEESWNHFAAACGSSFRSSYRGASAWQLDCHPLHRMRRYSLWLEQRRGRLRIGQAAIGCGPKLRVFADGLQLLPEHAGLWSEAMSCVLTQAGPGRYHYGSAWSLEPPRERECAALDGVTLTRVQPITMYAVDFARWPTWEAYLREVSSNARRNAKKAEKLHARLRVEMTHGLRMLRAAPQLLGLRRGLYARKQIPFSMLESATRLLLRASVMRENAFIALARIDEQPISAFGGVIFGENTYFVDAGSVQEDQGAYWYLMLRMLEDAYRRAPRGRFVTGAYYESTPVSSVLDFFRYQCRAEGHPTSEFEFTYAPAASMGRVSG
jgi:hypothetical protein